MQTLIHARLIDEPGIGEADRILRSCVHCGFCTAVCPTYQLTGDELDGPRGRIYLIKQLIEDDEIAPAAAFHLDRCLTCRACETACPSGVEYGRLLDFGRGLMTTRVKTGLRRRFLSRVLRFVVPSPALFGPLLKIGQFLRPIAPRALRANIPPRVPRRTGAPDAIPGQRSVVVLRGCVQRAATPNVNAALEYLLGHRGVTVRYVEDEGCCGALDYHLGAQESGRLRMKRLVERLEETGDVPIVSTASGCGVTVKEYPQVFADDPDFAVRARRIAGRVMDASELLMDFEFECSPRRVAVHVPCTLQHGQRLPDLVPQILARAGFKLVSVQDGHLCCGSAGTYSILQPALSGELRQNKRTALLANGPEVVVTANVGCQVHLHEDGDIPVMHWLELMADEARLGEKPPQ